MNKIEATINALNDIEKDLIIPREKEDLFAILFANHLISNGAPEVKPDLLLLSLRDAFYEYLYVTKNIENPKIENIFTKKYINELENRQWIYFNKHHNKYMVK